LSLIRVLQVIDDPVLRQAIEKQMDRIEHVHRFTRAVSVGNPREFLQAEKEDQEMAEACKRLIKNCIICWNYLYLSQKLEEITDAESREALLDYDLTAIANEDGAFIFRELNGKFQKVQDSPRPV
jgi:TnpA family transposase